MFSLRLRPLFRALALTLAAVSVVPAQTPTARVQTPSPMHGNIFGSSGQTQSTTQQDATRPPGVEQNPTLPPQARPVPADPTAPPGTQRQPNPTAPPAGNAEPQIQPTETPAPALETPVTTTDAPETVQPAPSTPAEEGIAEPTFPTAQPRPLPPFPNLARLGVQTGEQRSLSLNEAIRRALENNNEIEMARQDVRLAETFLRAYQGAYDPLFELQPQYSHFISPQESTLGGSDATGTVKQTNFQVNPSVGQRFTIGGGQYNVFFNNSRSTNSSSFNVFNPVYSANLGVQLQQPLWRGRSIDIARRNIRVQKKIVEQSDADFRRRTIEVIAQVQRAYWDLVFALRDEQNQIANLNLARENFRRTEASVVAGASAPLERAEVQTELSNRESALLLASQNVTIAENALKALILRDQLAPEWSLAIVPTDQPQFDQTPINLQDAINEARANRPELRRLHIQEDINNIDVQYYKNQTKPAIDIVSTLSTTGLAGASKITARPSNVPLIFGSPQTDADVFLLGLINDLRRRNNLSDAVVPTVEPQIPTTPSNLVGGYGQMLRNLFTLDTRNVVVGVRISLPFRNRTAEANLTAARIQQERLSAVMRSQEQVVEVEVRNAATAAETARRRVIAARTARENAELQLQGERRLYQVGRSTTFLLFQRENQLVNARNQELRAETDYNKALAELQRATSTTLRANNVIIESASAQ